MAVNEEANVAQQRLADELSRAGRHRRRRCHCTSTNTTTASAAATAATAVCERVVERCEQRAREHDARCVRRRVMSGGGSAATDLANVESAGRRRRVSVAHRGEQSLRSHHAGVQQSAASPRVGRAPQCVELAARSR